jgi:trans-aconitate methyltransferase
MKKYIIHLVIFALFYNSNNYTINIQEWNAQEYAQGNSLQYQSSLHFLETNNIKIEDKRIVDVGCGTGEISAFLAQNAELVDGFDASNNMIEWAQEHYGNQLHNISFRQCGVEDFSTTEKYDLATMFFCFHWFTDKQKAFDNVAACLNENGELFGTFSTTDTPQHPGHAIIKSIMKEWDIDEDFNEAMARSAVSTQELKEMMNNAGFEIITCSLQTSNIIFRDRIHVECCIRPVIMSRPFIKKMILEDQEKFLQEYVDRLIIVFQKNDAGGFTHMLHTTIVHARKKPLKS